MLKWIKIIFGLFALLLVTAIVLIYTVDANRYKGAIINAVEDSTGRQLQINGNLHFAASLIPTIIVEDAKFSNASWGSKPDMVSLDKFEVQVSLMPLFSKEVQINRFILLKPTILLETNKDGVGNWVFESKNKEDTATESDSVLPAIVFNKIEIRNAKLIYKDGVTGQKTNIAVEEFSSLSAGVNDAISILLKMAYNTTPIKIEGSVGSLNQLLANTQFPLDLAINANKTIAKIKGSIAKPMDGNGLNLAVNFTADALSQLAVFSSAELPEISNIKLKSTISDSIGIDLQAVYQEVPVEIKGTLGSLDKLLANTRFPVDLNINANNAIAKIKGTIAKPLTGKGLDLAVNFDAQELSQLAAFSPSELPEVSAISLKGMISKAIALDLKAIYKEAPVDLKGDFGSLDQLLANENFPVDLAITVNNAIAKVKGSVASPLEGKGVDVVVNFDADALSQLAAFSPTELPDVTAISLSTTINDSLSIALKAVYSETPIELNGTLGSIDQLMANENYPIDLTVIANEAKAVLKGTIAKPMDAKGFDLSVDFNAQSLSQLSKLAESELPDLGPVDFSGKVTEADNLYSISGMTLALGKTDLAGSISADLTGEIPDIAAMLTSDMIDIVELTGGTQDETKETEKTKEADSKERLFSSDPLPLESLKSVNANVTINAKQIKTSSMVFRKTKLIMTLQDGDLAIKPLDTFMAGGNIYSTLNLKNTGKTAKLTADIRAKDIEPSEIGDLKKQLSGVVTDATIKLKGSGSSISQIMAGLNGQIIVQSDEGSLKSSAGNMLGTDLLSSLNPFSASSDETKLQCIAVKFDITDGIAKTDDGIAISMEKMNIIGNGTIDLKTEKVNITIDPQSREGVGLNAGKLASMVKLGGTLANPKPIADAAGTLTTGLSVGTALATGGVSLLVEGLVDRVTAEVNPCDVALGKVPKPVQQAEPTITPAAAPVPAEPVNEVNNIDPAPLEAEMPQEAAQQ